MLLKAERGACRQPPGQLLGRERLAAFALGDRIALLKLVGRERAAIDKKTVDLAGTLRERLAEDRRAALLSRALAAVCTAGPIDLTGNDSAARRARRLGRIIGRGGRSGNGCKRRQSEEWTKHRY